MSIENADIEFDNRNIIQLCGYNDSGKSAVIRLLDIMFYNAYSSVQAKFIKDGASYFKGVLNFDDGVSYERIKYANGLSIYNLRKGDKLLYTNKNGDTVISVNDIPQVIKDYLGVVRDEEGTKEELNVRRCADRLFLIDTTGGDNYKILNSILQSDILAKTTANLNTDKNALQSELTVKYSKLSTMKSERDRVVVSDRDSIDDFGTNIEKFKGVKDRYNTISNISSLSEKIEKTIIPDELSVLDIERITEINGIKGVQAKATQPIQEELAPLESKELERVNDVSRMLGVQDKANQPIQEELSVLDNVRLESLVSLVNLNKIVNKPIQSNIDIVDTERLSAIGSIVERKERIGTSDLSLIETVSSADIDKMGVFNLYQRYKEYCTNYDNIDNEYNEVTGIISKMAKEYDFKICKNCGSIVTD